jgi:prokaryotic ubiquitin-like protein Pup
MSEEQVQKRRGKKASDQDVEGSAPSTSSEKLKEDIDELLDEIDTVLEENAEEFVRSYVQKGGQ